MWLCISCLLQKFYFSGSSVSMVLNSLNGIPLPFLVAVGVGGLDKNNYVSQRSRHTSSFLAGSSFAGCS